MAESIENKQPSNVVDTVDTPEINDKKLDDITKEQNKDPNVLPRITERMERSSVTREKIKQMLEKGIKDIVEKGGTLTSTPEGIQNAKKLIAYNILEGMSDENRFGKKIDKKLKENQNSTQTSESFLAAIRELGEEENYFPEKPDEQINRASHILEELVKVNNFDKKIWQTVRIEKCDTPMQTISYEVKRTSGNDQIDQIVKTNSALKKYLDNRATNANLCRLEAMTDRWYYSLNGKREDNPNEQLNKEIRAKIESRWRSSRYSGFDITDTKQTNDFLALISKIPLNDLNSPEAYDIKDLMINILNTSGDRTFTWRDLWQDDGVDTEFVEDREGNIIDYKKTIKQPFVKTDNVQIISISAEGIRMKNRVTGQEVTLGEKTVQEAKRIKDQRESDRKYRSEKERKILEDLKIIPPQPKNLSDEEKEERREKEIKKVTKDMSREERQELQEKINKILMKEAFTTDKELFETFHREMFDHASRFGDTKGERIPPEFWQLFNEILQARGRTQVDFSKGRNFLKAEMLNGQRVFILNTPDYKITIPASWPIDVKFQPQMSQEEMNTPVQEQEKSPAYRRAEHAIEHPDGNKVHLSGLWLNSKEVTSLLASHSEKLSKIQDLQLDLSDNDITKFPTILFGMETLKKVDLDDNRIKEFRTSGDKVEIKKKECPNLQDISLDRNNLSSLPSEFLQLDQIKHLSLNDNRFSELPNDIKSLYNLETLQVSHNQLSKLPENIIKLPQLQHLFARNCGLKELPTDFNKLKNLISLNLENNTLKELPDISTLTQLEHLNISHNELATLPPLWSLEKLKTLHIEDNTNLKEIPNDIKTLPNLKSEIKLFNNIISGEEVKDRFVDGAMSRQGYDFPDGANQFFNNQQQFKYTYAQGGSESEALANAQETLNINEKTPTFAMTKQLKNGNYSVVLFTQANEKEYYKK